MKNIFILSGLLAFAGSLAAQTSNPVPGDKVLYYAGVETRTSLFGGPQVIEQLVVKKSLLPSQNLMTEFACIKADGEPAQTVPVLMKVVGNLITAISSDPAFVSGPLTGTGDLSGTPWDWNYLKFSMNYAVGIGTVRIEDENWVSGSHLIAIKETYWNDGSGAAERKTSVITAKAQEVTQAEYEAKLAELGCP